MSVIGSGLIAQAFMPEFSQRNEVIIFASGVSNALGITDEGAEREKDLLSKTLSESLNHQLIVYFGTCSVYSNSSNSKYVLHKLAMEDLIKTAPNFLILRLPQLAGYSTNGSTLLNFLAGKIFNKQHFNLQINASRNIIDVEDVVNISNKLINNSLFINSIVNVASSITYNVIDIVKAFEQFYNKTSIFSIIESESHYEIDITRIMPILLECEIKFDSSYLYYLINKYYRKNENPTHKQSL